MPEIIEAEITKQKLTLALKGKRILEFRTDWPRGLYSEKKSYKRTAKAIEGSKIVELDRVGKVVVINLEGGKVLALHQRMSGYVALFSSENDKPKHTHFIFKLDDGTNFALNDPRKFGTVWYGSEKWFFEQPYVKNLGIDVLKLDKKDFIYICEDAFSSSSVKSFLLRQDKIAGLGNIACDELLWRAKISPNRKMGSFDKKELSSLYTAIRATLRDVLRHGGTSMSDWFHPDGKKGNYQDNFKVYSLDICSRCNSLIKRIKIAGRGTYYCIECQK